MFLYEGDADKAEEAAYRASKKAAEEGKKVGFISFGGDAKAAARLFFKELRRCDAEGADIIFAVGVPEEEEGIAVMDRMRSAAGGNIINV